jgi:hypothetical protein
VTVMLSRSLVQALFVVLFCCSISWGQQGDDLRDLRVGMPISAIPPDEYVDLSCAGTNDQTIGGWSDFRKCPKTTAGLYAVSFHFNNGVNGLAQVNDSYQGTKVAGHPVVLSLLIDDQGTIDALRIDTDPKARLFWRKKAYLLALAFKNRYGEDGWECRNREPTAGETAVGGVLIMEHCEKNAEGRQLLLDRAVYRAQGQPINDFVNETHIEIRHIGGASRSAFGREN